jgi:hypothetical protein
MGKLTLNLSDKLEETLRTYISKKYPQQTFGKISEITEKALAEYLENHPIEG